MQHQYGPFGHPHCNVFNGLSALTRISITGVDSDFYGISSPGIQRIHNVLTASFTFLPPKMEKNG